MNQSKSYPKVLSIAGSDSSGGAGIQADLKTFSALGVYGATAITAITARNTQGVNSQFALPPQMVYDQIAAVMDDIEPSVVKIGMLSNTAIVEAVAKALHDYKWIEAVTTEPDMGGGHHVRQDGERLGVPTSGHGRILEDDCRLVRW